MPRPKLYHTEEERKEANRLRCLKYTQNNKEKCREKSKAYYHKNKDKIKEQRRQKRLLIKTLLLK